MERIHSESGLQSLATNARDRKGNESFSKPIDHTPRGLVSDLKLRVEVRKDGLTLRDEPSKLHTFTMQRFVSEEADLLPCNLIRPFDLSFAKFIGHVNQTLQLQYDADRDAFGWIRPPLYPNLKHRFTPIKREGSFRTAVGNFLQIPTSDPLDSPMVIHLFSPKLEGSVFGEGEGDVRLISRPILMHIRSPTTLRTSQDMVVTGGTVLNSKNHDDLEPRPAKRAKLPVPVFEAEDIIMEVLIEILEEIIQEIEQDETTHSKSPETPIAPATPVANVMHKEPAHIETPAPPLNHSAPAAKISSIKPDNPVGSEPSTLPPVSGNGKTEIREEDQDKSKHTSTPGSSLNSGGTTEGTSYAKPDNPGHVQPNVPPLVRGDIIIEDPLNTEPSVQPGQIQPTELPEVPPISDDIIMADTPKNMPSIESDGGTEADEEEEPPTQHLRKPLRIENRSLSRSRTPLHTAPEPDIIDLEETPLEIPKNAGQASRFASQGVPEKERKDPEHTDDCLSKKVVPNGGNQVDFASFQLDAADLNMDDQYEDETNEEYQLRADDRDRVLNEIQVQRMQATIDSKACMQLSDDNWLKCCEFFGHDPTKNTCKDAVKIVGWGVGSLFPCQAHCVYRTLLARNGMNKHIFNANSMGLGKGRTCFAEHLIQHKINLVRDEIKKHPEKHLPKNSKDGECPSDTRIWKKFGFSCPCQPGSPTKPFRSYIGVGLLMSPNGLLLNLNKEFINVYGEKNGRITKRSNPFGIEFAIAHRWSTVQQDNVFDLRRQGMCRGKIDPDRAGLEESDPPKVLPCLGNNRCIVATTPQSFETYFLKMFESTWAYEYTPPDTVKTPKTGKNAGITTITPGKTRTIKKTYHHVRLISLTIDECHQQRKDSSPMFLKLKESFFDEPQQSELSIRPMSGTLITTGPTCIAQYVRYMALHAGEKWRDHPVLRNWMIEYDKEGYELEHRCIALGEEWDKLLLKGHFSSPRLDEILKEFTPLVEALVLRFTPKSNFLNTGPVVLLKPSFYLELGCKHSNEWSTRLERHRQEEYNEIQEREKTRQKLYFARKHTINGYVKLATEAGVFYYRHRVVATVPGLLDVRDNGEPMQFTLEEFKKKKKDKEWTDEKNPYIDQIDKWGHTSGKFKKLTDTVIRPWKNVLDGLGQPTRIGVVSYFYAVIYVYYLYLTLVENVPESEIVFVSKLMSSAQIQKQLDKFQQGVDGVFPRYLLGQSSCFSVGFTLTELTILVMLEPDYRVAMEMQTFARHNRFGNKNDYTLSLLCFAEGNEREALIMNRNRQKSTMCGIYGEDEKEKNSLGEGILDPTLGGTREVIKVGEKTKQKGAGAAP